MDVKLLQKEFENFIQLQTIKEIMSQRKSFKQCSCGFEYMDLGQGNTCPSCNQDIDAALITMFELNDINLD